MIVQFSGRHRPKETARRVHEEQEQAGDQKSQSDFTRDELDGAIGECRMLAILQRRLARFNAYLYPLTGNTLLISLPGGFTRCVPSLHAARAILLEWEGAHG